MAFCGKCGNQLEDGVKFCPKCGQPTDGSYINQPQGGYQPNYGGQNQQPQNRPRKPETYMIWAILTTILCCLPTGIYAIILANKVDTLYLSGMYYEAEEASRGAKKWSIIGAVVAAIGWLLYIGFIVLFVFLGASSNF